MFNFFIIMDEIQGNNIARNFSSEYFNYTINFIISKEFPSLPDFPDFSLVLCDLDKNIERAKKYNLPVIAFSHKNNSQESLMGTPWLILDIDALSPFFIKEVYCRYNHLPLTVATTNHYIIRELTATLLPELLLLQKENSKNPSGCFFPQNCTTYSEAKEFLLNYIKNQYSFYGYGIYGIFNKEKGTFLGIAGFSAFENILDTNILNVNALNLNTPNANIPNINASNIKKEKPKFPDIFPDKNLDKNADKIFDKNSNEIFNEYCAEIGYSILKKWQQQGVASEVLPSLIRFGKEYLGFTKIITRIEKNNIASIRLAKKNNLILVYEIAKLTNPHPL